MFRFEAERLQQEAATVCIRDISARSAIFDELSSSSELLSLIQSDLTPVRSILFDKTKNENWPVLWHQDLTIAVRQKIEVAGYAPWSEKNGIPHVQPPIKVLENMATLRIHLDEAPEKNGALRVIPKTHLLGKIPSDEIERQVADQAITCECEAGDVLLMSPLILHSSGKSKAPNSRKIMHFEYARLSDLSSRLNWANYAPVQPN